MSTIGQLIVKVGADTSDLTKGLLKAQKDTETTGSKIKKVGQMVAHPVVAVADRATSVLARIKESLFSLQGLATITLSVIGIDKLKDSTLGAAMTFQEQQVSMNHWLNNNKKAVSEVISWLDKFAAKTPYEMADLFPAMTRGIGISNGDIKTAERLVSLATDMAALTPGKTVEDAMEALADAQMGEYERLKEFNMKYSKAQADAAGGFAGLIKDAEKKFKGGADELSATAGGLFSTITDNINTYARKSGEGFLTALMPRLQKVTDWFNNHPRTVARWKNEMVTLGNQAGEYMFSRLESAFRYIQSNYIDNPAFTHLSFTGKINFIIDDIAKLLDKWWNSGGSRKTKAFGAKVGTAIGEGIASVLPHLAKVAALAFVNAFVDGLNSSPIGAMIAGAIAGGGIGSVVPGFGTVAGAAAGALAGDVTYHLTGQPNTTDTHPNLTQKFMNNRPPIDVGALMQAGKNANGTDFWRGGWTWINERGAELVNLPRGTQIKSNRESMAMMNNGVVKHEGTIYHVFQTNDRATVAKIAEEYNRDNRRIPTRVSTIPITI